MNEEKRLDWFTSTLVAILIPLLSISTFFGTAGADGQECNPLDLQACQDLNHGSVTISDGARRKVVEAASKSSQSGRLTTDQINRLVATQFCRDAGTNTSAGGNVTREVAALCRGFIAAPMGREREDVVRAFKELPLYKGVIRTEPRRWTLVNLETFFWCGDDDGRTCDLVGGAEKKLTLLGQPVRIRPKIVDYSWDFGDGTTAQVTGRAAHTYAHAGDRTVTLTLTWTADYALGAGAFQPIDDTTTTTSAPRVLPVREAQTVIVEG